MSLLYKLSGIMMTGLLLAGYGICIANIVYTSQSVCGSTSLGTLSRVNSIVFLVVASLVLVGSHTIIWFPICRTYCGKRKSTQAVLSDDSSSQKINSNSSTPNIG